MGVCSSSPRKRKQNVKKIESVCIFKKKLKEGKGGGRKERKKEKGKKPSHAVGKLMNGILVIYPTKGWKAKKLILKAICLLKINPGLK